MISPLLCVAMAVYFEARGESQVAGHIAIAEVIENQCSRQSVPGRSLLGSLRCEALGRASAKESVPVHVLLRREAGSSLGS